MHAVWSWLGVNQAAHDRRRLLFTHTHNHLLWAELGVNQALSTEQLYSRHTQRPALAAQVQMLRAYTQNTTSSTTRCVLEQIHRRCANEACYKSASRSGIHLGGCGELL